MSDMWTRKSKKIYNNLTKRRRILSGSIGEYVIVAIVLIFLSMFYTGFSVLTGNYTLFTDQTGDGTAGVTWQMYADKDMNPAYGETDIVNYPDGINLSDPSKITSILVSFPLWLISRITTSFMATNILQIVAYTMMGIVTYLFIKRITNRWYIALFASFAATFYPYMLFKSIIHIDNIFSWVFMFELMAMIYAWKNPSWRSALVVAVSIAVGYYSDGYYLLISTVFAAAITCGISLANVYLRFNKAQWLQYGVNLATSLAILILLVLPIVATRIAQGSSIEKSLGRSAASVKYDMNTYASTKLDFLVPPNNPFLKNISWYQDLVKKQESYAHSNSVERSVYIGYVVIFLSLAGLLIFIWVLIRRGMGLDMTGSDRTMFIVLSSITIISIMVFLSFMAPERVSLFGMKIKTLSGVLTDHVYLWRVLARFILPLHAILVVYASFVLYILIKYVKPIKLGRKGPVILTFTLMALCALEYATTANRPIFDLRKMPQTYTYLKDRKDINVIAELPIQDDTPNAYYITAQYIHGKKLVNDQEPKYNIGQFSPLGTDENPDTIDFIRQRGAEAVINRSPSCSEKTWGDLIYKERVSGEMDGSDPHNAPLLYFQTGNRWLCTYKLKTSNSNIDSSYIISPEITTSYNTRFYTTQAKNTRVEMRIADYRQRDIKDKSSNISFSAFSTGNLPYSWRVIQDRKVINNGYIQAGEKVTISATVNTNSHFFVEYTLLTPQKYTSNDIRMMNYVSTLLPTN